MTSSGGPGGPPELVVVDEAAWRAWLAEHHGEPDGVWLVLARVGTERPTRLRYAEALDQALCFGWIDGQVRRRDETTFRQRFTPRRPRGAWSARNVAHVQRLTAGGLMHPAGLAEVDRARADGRWEAAYAGPATAAVPEDLAAALAASRTASARFARLTSQNRYAILHRLGLVKRPETRARRVAEYVAMLERGETIHPQKRTLDP